MVEEFARTMRDGWQATLVAPDELAGITGEVVLIDCRDRPAFDGGHLPGARHLALDPWLKEPNHRGGMVSAAAFAAEMGRLGVDGETTVVPYDAWGMLFAARLWWVLRQHGHRRARVLDGGWQRWTSEGRPVVQAPDPAWSARTFVASPGTGSATAADVLRRLGDPGVVLLDVRRPDEWSGEDRYHNARIGHLPGAVHLLWSELVADDEQRAFRPPREMRAILADLGVTPEKEVVIYCQAAIRAAHTALALHRLGYPRVLVYEGSMAEWTTLEGVPLVVDGPPPGRVRVPAGR
jgi:thiosulfate/3-mercaptopyruvate sulfurtransferase